MSVGLSRRAFLRSSAAVSVGLCVPFLCAERAAAVIFPGGQTAVIDAGGDSVRLRGTPSKTGEVKSNIGDGAVVLVTDGPKSDSSGNSWYQVQYAGQGGWVMADYISARKLTGYAAVTFTDGQGVRLRDNTDTNAKVVGMVPEGAIVLIVEGPRLNKDGTPWYHINHAGKHGYLMGTYLVPSTAANSESVGAKMNPEAQASSAPDVIRDDRVKIVNTDGAGVRMRDEANYSAEIVAIVEEGTVVTVIASIVKDSKGNEWVPVSFDGTKGYVVGPYVSKTSDPATKRKGLAAPVTGTATASGTPVAGATPAPAPVSAPASATASGSQVVTEAMKYVGSPYVWAGASPKGFDCSGFTMFIAKQVVGKDISHSIGSQAGAGQYVSKENLQPGDFVYFANTYTAGLSHAGIYIGGGRFVHAENEGTGVVVSSLNNGYYGPKYYTARRLG